MGFKKNYFSPLVGLKYIFSKPITIRIPKVKREASDNYRGFHANDLEKCIGCGTCSSICPTNAINMTEFKEIKDEEGSKPERPVIDYGRCSFCGLCVDICTTGSLTMTKEYIHKSINPDDFNFLPDVSGIHHNNYAQGYQRTENSDLLDLKRNELEAMEPVQRSNSFIEFLNGFSHEMAYVEASRCVECGICTKTCPANMNIPEYIRSIWENNLDEGVEWLYKTNPLPGVCGRVCTHKCETVCALGHRGEPIAIRWLKRYIVDNTPEEDYDSVSLKEVIRQIDGSVAIIGSGPAGLSAAYYLARLGYSVDIYEKNEKPGGVMRYGIPAYRLPDSALDRDISIIEKLGVKIHCRTEIGKNTTFDQLKKSHDYIYIATGFSNGRSTNVKGSEHKDVKQALPLLAQIRDYVRNPEKIPEITENMIVIGGGNVAMDIARSLVRLQKKHLGKGQVTLTCLESRNEMPADEEEIVESQEEGVIIHPGWGPAEIIEENGKIKGLLCIKCLSVFDETGRFNPKFDAEKKISFEGNSVIEAIGQAPDYSYIPENIQKQLIFERGRVKSDKDGKTLLPWLYAGGDIIEGPDIIHAIANGHNTARSIDDSFLKKND